MRATILAAGIGQRLEKPNLPPKILLKFGDDSLLARHVRILRHCGFEGIDMVVGYRSELIEQELQRIGARDFVRLHKNENYLRGSIVSFWTLREVYASGQTLVFMDGDVLYDHRLIERLVNSPHENCFLMDRQIEEGEDPVKLCFADGALVDFHKRPELAHDWWGEWIGFARFSPQIAGLIGAAGNRIVEADGEDEIYECYPTYPVDDIRAAIGKYWDDYYARCGALAQKYPDHVRIFDIGCLSDDSGQRDILHYCGFAAPVVGAPVHRNKGTVSDGETQWPSPLVT